MVEKLRYFRPPIPHDQRYCVLCKTQVEDEVHFMFQCKQLASIERARYIETITTHVQTFNGLTDTEKYKYVMTQCDETVTRLTANYIKLLYNKRTLAISLLT